MSDAVMYAFIKKLVHSLLKSTRQKQQKVVEKTAQKSVEKAPQKAAEKRQCGHHIVMTYDQRNKEKTGSNTSTCSSLVVNPNTYRALPAVLAHPDT
jgi:hypothetical protein